MKFVSLDLETYRLEPRTPDGIIMISMVAEDTDKPTVPVENLPSFTAIIEPETNTINGSLFALSMNAWLMVTIEMHKNLKNEGFKQKLLDAGVPEITVNKARQAVCRYSVMKMDKMVDAAQAWLNQQFGTKDRITVCGKNVAGFDMRFLPPSLAARFRHAVIDIGCLFIDWDNDRQVPSTEKVMDRIGMGLDGLHDAYEDAMAAIYAVRAAHRQQKDAVSAASIDKPLTYCPFCGIMGDSRVVDFRTGANLLGSEIVVHDVEFLSCPDCQHSWLQPEQEEKINIAIWLEPRV
jgi:hypothetical protein